MELSKWHAVRVARLKGGGLKSFHLEIHETPDMIRFPSMRRMILKVGDWMPKYQAVLKEGLGGRRPDYIIKK